MGHWGDTIAQTSQKNMGFFSIGFCTEDLQFAKRSWTKIS